MRVSPVLRLQPTLFETFPRAWTHPPRAATTVSPITKSRQLMGSTSRTTDAMADNKMAEYGVETTQINTAPGVELGETERLLTGSVLDLFAGRPSLKKLSLWSDTATFADPLTIAEGRRKYAAQWYGLVAAFSEIKRLSSSVVSGGNPIEIDLKTMYKVKGLGTQHEIESKVKIFHEGGTIERVEDRWNDKLPEGAFSNAMRNLNSVVVPAFVGVPRSEEEEAKKRG